MKRAALGLLCLAQALQAAPRPVMAHFTTCAQLTPGLYPADTTTWFESSKNPQIVLYAHMLFPLLPEPPLAAAPPAPLAEAWHPPMAVPAPKPAAAAEPQTISVQDRHLAQADWIDPDGSVIASLSLTLPARVSQDYVLLQGRQYIPHTFAMTIGTKDLRAGAGQKALPAKAGQYHVRLYVDGEVEGIAFFRMLGGQAAAAAGALSATAQPLPRAVMAAPEEGGLNALRDVFRALTKTGN